MAICYKNHLLQTLGEDSLQRLKPKPGTFDLLQNFEHVGSPIRFLYFIEEGVASGERAIVTGGQELFG